MQERLARSLTGTGLAVVGAVAYGVTAVVGRALALAGFRMSTVNALRFGGAAVIVFVLVVALRRPLLPARGERLATIFVIGGGFLVVAILFFAGLERGSAGMVALLFFVFPAVTLLIELVLGTRPSSRSLIAMAMALIGAAIVSIAGIDLSITPAGAVFSLLSGTVYGASLVAADRLAPKTDEVTKSGWVLLVVGAGSALIGVGQGSLQNPSSEWWLFTLNALASAGTFAFIFAAMNYISATRVGVIMTLEAATAVGLGWVFLDEPLDVIQLLGGAIILGAAAIIALDQQADPGPSYRSDSGSICSPRGKS